MGERFHTQKNASKDIQYCVWARRGKITSIWPFFFNSYDSTSALYFHLVWLMSSSHAGLTVTCLWSGGQLSSKRNKLNVGYEDLAVSAFPKQKEPARQFDIWNGRFNEMNVLSHQLLTFTTYFKKKITSKLVLKPTRCLIYEEKSHIHFWPVDGAKFPSINYKKLAVFMKERHLCLHNYYYYYYYY